MNTSLARDMASKVCVCGREGGGERMHRLVQDIYG